MYSELLFFPQSAQGLRLYGHQARNLLAKAADQKPIDPRVFWRTEDGKPRNGTPSVCFGGGVGLIRVCGLGEEGAAVVREQAPFVASYLSEGMDTPYRFRLVNGQCDIRPSGPRLYVMQDVVLSRHASEIDKYKESGNRHTLGSVMPLLRRAIVDGLTTQAQMLHENGGGAKAMAIASHIGTPDQLNLEVLEGQPLFAPINPRAQVLICKNVLFLMDLQLEGPWFVGGLRSRGHGRISAKVVRN